MWKFKYGLCCERSDYLVTAIKFCVPLNEVNIQTDAQFLYNTFNLISVILDGCEDAAGFAATLLKDTEILSLIKRQLTRDDFDDNVLAAKETLAILLQMQPNLLAKKITSIIMKMMKRLKVEMENYLIYYWDL